MPKVIENLEERILDAAESLFSELGYNDVDMRAISQKAGIAVGTLYNYFPDKKTLFVESFKKSWGKTFLKIDGIIEAGGTTREKLVLFINEVYDGIARRRGIGIQLLIDSLHSISEGANVRSNIQYSNSLEEIGTTLQGKAKILIGQTIQIQSIQLDEYIVDKLADALILLVWGSASKQMEDKMKNIDFICDVIEAYISAQAM